MGGCCLWVRESLVLSSHDDDDQLREKAIKWLGILMGWRDMEAPCFINEEERETKSMPAPGRMPPHKHGRPIVLLLLLVSSINFAR